VATDTSTWTDVFSTTKAAQRSVTDETFSTATARYVRMLGTQRGTTGGYSLYDFLVLNDTGVTTAVRYKAGKPALAAGASLAREKGSIRYLYQGVLQAAVTYFHITRGNYEGAVKLYERCMKLLKDYPDVCRGIQVGRLKNDLDRVIQEVQRLGQERINEFDRSLFKDVEWNEQKVWVCDSCGSQMYEKNCKVICPNCGNNFDCSDLNLYFD
jgi:hypothetical protein